MMGAYDGPPPTRNEALRSRVLAIVSAGLAIVSSWYLGLFWVYGAISYHPSLGPGYDRGAAYESALSLWRLLPLPGILALIALVWPWIVKTPSHRRTGPWTTVQAMFVAYMALMVLHSKFV